MKTITRIMSAVLSAIMILSTFSVNSFAVATVLQGGNSMNNATAIPSFGIEYVSTLSSSTEEDWFKFTTMSQDAYYRVELVNYSLPEGLHYFENPGLLLCDANQKEIGYRACSYGDGFLSYKLENNTTYFIRVTHERVSEAGNYELTVSYTFDVVPNEKDNSLGVATDTLISNSFDGTGDVDWYSFVAPSNGDYTITFNNGNIESSSSSYGRNANVYLYDKFDQILSSDYVSMGCDAVLNATLENGETYYIKAFMGSSAIDKVGNYTLYIDSPLDTIVPVTLNSIRVSSLPAKTNYLIGESFNESGLLIEALYSDNSSKLISNYSLSGFDSSSVGNKTITVAYSEGEITKTCSFSITVVSSDIITDSPDNPSSTDPNEDSEISTSIWDLILNALLKFVDFFVLISNIIISFF